MHAWELEEKKIYIYIVFEITSFSFNYLAAKKGGIRNNFVPTVWLSRGSIYSKESFECFDIKRVKNTALSGILLFGSTNIHHKIVITINHCDHHYHHHHWLYVFIPSCACPTAVTETSDIAPVLSKEFLDI